MAISKTFKDDIFTGNRKYNLIENADDTISLVDVTEYSESGSIIDAALFTEIVNGINGNETNISGLQSKTNITNATLSAGNTTITFTNSSITADSIFSFYTSIYGVSPTEVSVSSGSVTLTFDAQDEDMEVGVRLDG